MEEAVVETRHCLIQFGVGKMQMGGNSPKARKHYMLKRLAHLVWGVEGKRYLNQPAF